MKNFHQGPDWRRMALEDLDSVLEHLRDFLYAVIPVIGLVTRFLEVAFCSGLCFVLDCVLSKILRFALEESCVLKTFYCVLPRTDSAKLKNALRFVLHCVLPWKHCVLPISKQLHFALEDLAICLKKILRFVFKDCVLSLYIMRFVYKALRFEKNNLDRPPMLATGRYPQWCSRFLRYINTRPNGEALRKCILSGPYKPTNVLVQAVDATDDSPAFPKHTTVKTPINMSPENKAHFEAGKEAIHLILTGIRDEIYVMLAKQLRKCGKP
nr:hypothetical protein [Tanacetum cinerariifolium]